MATQKNFVGMIFSSLKANVMSFIKEIWSMGKVKTSTVEEKVVEDNINEKTTMVFEEKDDKLAKKQDKTFEAKNQVQTVKKQSSNSKSFFEDDAGCVSTEKSTHVFKGENFTAFSQEDKSTILDYESKTGVAEYDKLASKEIYTPKKDYKFQAIAEESNKRNWKLDAIDDFSYGYERRFNQVECIESETKEIHSDFALNSDGVRLKGNLTFDFSIEYVHFDKNGQCFTELVGGSAHFWRKSKFLNYEIDLCSTSEIFSTDYTKRDVDLVLSGKLEGVDINFNSLAYMVKSNFNSEFTGYNLLNPIKKETLVLPTNDSK